MPQGTASLLNRLVQGLGWPLHHLLLLLPRRLQATGEPGLITSELLQPLPSDLREARGQLLEHLIDAVERSLAEDPRVPVLLEEAELLHAREHRSPCRSEDVDLARLRVDELPLLQHLAEGLLQLGEHADVLVVLVQGGLPQHQVEANIGGLHQGQVEEATTEDVDNRCVGESRIALAQDRLRDEVHWFSKRRPETCQL